VKVFVQLADFRAQSYIGPVFIKRVADQIEKHGVLIRMEMIENGLMAIKKIFVVDAGEAVPGAIHDHIQMGHDITRPDRVPVGDEIVDLPCKEVHKLMAIQGHFHEY
jgi:hypothetical protein